MPSLLIVTGTQQGTYFALPGRPLVAGRDPANEIQIRDAKVSRRHFMVVPKGATFAVRALRSTNGIRVNGVSVAGERALDEGDVVAVGDTELEFSFSDQPARHDAIRDFRKVGKALREKSTELDEK